MKASLNREEIRKADVNLNTILNREEIRRTDGSPSKNSDHIYDHLYLDYHNLLQYVGEDRFLVDAYCYVPINPRNEHRLDREIEDLWRSGYIVNTKLGTIAGGTYKCNFDVEITMDMLKAMYQVKPDIIVLATGDSDFIPLIQEVRKAGVRVEVAAFVETAGTDIMLKCSGFINLALYYAGYLATQNGEQGEGSKDEQYKALIQLQDSDQNEDAVKLPVDQVGNETGVPVPDTIDVQFGVSINVANGDEMRVPAPDTIDDLDL